MNVQLPMIFLKPFYGHGVTNPYHRPILRAVARVAADYDGRTSWKSAFDQRLTWNENRTPRTPGTR